MNPDVRGKLEHTVFQYLDALFLARHPKLNPVETIFNAVNILLRRDLIQSKIQVRGQLAQDCDYIFLVVLWNGEVFSRHRREIECYYYRRSIACFPASLRVKEYDADPVNPGVGVR